VHVEMRPTDSIRPYERNPRINDHAVDAVAESIRRFGFRQPIVVDADGVIVCGHTRWKAARKLGLTEVPVHVATDLTPAQTRAYRLADNRIAEMAEWEPQALAEELIALGELQVDMQPLGFAPAEARSAEQPGEEDIDFGTPSGEKQRFVVTCLPADADAVFADLRALSARYGGCGVYRS